MTKKEYQTPRIRIAHIQAATMLEGSTETLPFDPGDGTDEALSKDDDADWGGSVWKD